MDANCDWSDKLELVHRAAISVAAAHDVEEALQAIADSAREVAGAEMSALGVPGQPGEPMAHFVVSGLLPEVTAQAGLPPMGRGVLGVLLREGKPVRIDDIAQHPAFEGVPDRHPALRSFLGVPVQSGGEVLGDLYLANKIGAAGFTAEDQRLVEMLAAHAAVVIQTLRYHRQNEELAVVRAQARLAPKIEDDVLQALYGAGLLLGALDLHDAERAAAQLRDIQQRLDSAIKHLRAHLLAMADPRQG